MTSKPVLIGADPEAFLVNEDGKLISSIGLIGGSKFAPLDCGDGFAIQEDNVAVEFNIPPAKSREEFVDSINIGLNHLKNAVSKFNLTLAFLPSGNFTKDQLEHPMAKEFGCEPDFNAWTRKVNKKPKANDASLRSCGGHIHVGENKIDPFFIGQWMDLFLGVPFLLIDTDVTRRKLYGKAGAMRVKPYGMEYRVLSNKWLTSPELTSMVYDETQKAVEIARKEGPIKKKWGTIIRRAINKSDLSAVLELKRAFPMIAVPNEG